MSYEASIEARELVAARAIAHDAEELRARALEEPAPERAARYPDTRAMASDANRSLASDPWRAALFAEAHVTGARRRAWSALHEVALRKPVKLRGEAEAIPWDGCLSAMITEPNAARREAIRAAFDAETASLRGASRDVLDALRASLGALDGALVDALGFGDAGCGDLLDATDDLYGELDAWVSRGLDLDPRRVTWTDRLRSLAGHATLVAVPPATWSELGGRPYARIGLDGALRGVVDELRPASRLARGVRALVTAPGERATLVGRPVVAAWGAHDVLGAVWVAASSTLGRGPFPGVRRGLDRTLDGLAHALGRRLLLERHFLRKEAGLDAAPRERVLLEGIHAELLRLRRDAALARFATHLLSRAPEPAARLHDELVRAWGASPALSWAPWVSASMFDADGLLGGRWAAYALGARVEPVVVAHMRARFDEDWFRNPRAGAGLSAVFDEVRAVGLRAWCEANGGVPGAKVAASRLDEALTEARRAL